MKIIRMIFYFLKDILTSRKLIYDLAKNDLKKRYLGSYFGIVWGFVQPLISILIFWFVFQVGFKSAPVDNFPFILWLMCGMIPWFYISDSILGAATSVVDNSYLVKKVVFRVSVLPIIRIVSALFIHIVFILVLFVMFIIYGYAPDLYALQVLYYLICTIMITLGISWINSSLVVFLRDFGQIVNILIQFGFWITPIMWSMNIMPKEYHFILKLNPFFYIIEGYRDCFINKVWFWQHSFLTANFWFISIVMLLVGILLFRRLKPHFADVL